jgi:hypothetical protein
MAVSQREAGDAADRAGAAEAARSGGSRRPGSAPAGLPPASTARRVAWTAGFAAASLVLFLCYLRVSRTVPVNSDGASNVLQAWDMLHGNLLLHGWALSDVSFYTTELPQYMLVASVRGLGPDVVHVAAAMTYTMLVLLAGLLAKGGASGREALVRVLIAAGIMLAPQLGSASYTLLLSPDHAGTSVPLLLVWLVIDRARPRWHVPVVVGVLLAWVQIADSLALLIGVAPLAIAGAIRACQGTGRRHRAAFPGRPAPSRPVPRWYDLSLAGAALASVGAAWLVIRLIRENGGFFVAAPSTLLAPAGLLPRHAVLAFQGVLELFGAGFSGQRGALELLFAAAHLAGVALAAWALILAVRWLLRWEDLLVPAFAIAILLNVAGYAVSLTPANIRSTREIAGVLPFGAVLAGRLLAGRMMKIGRPAGLALRSAAMVSLLCCVAALGYAATRPPVPAENQDLTAWLAGHHLSDGLGDYWQADSTTLDSGYRILVVAVGARGGKMAWGRTWETKLAWRLPRSHYANFVVTVSKPGYEAGLTQRAAWNAFGRPARTDRFGRYTVMIWDKNLLAAVG